MYKKRYYDSAYIIYTNGKCYSEKSKKFLKPQFSQKYPTYNLIINSKKKKIKVHRMVAEMFLEHDESHYIVNHKDGNTLNYDISNLEWVTPSENSQHAIIKGLRPKSNQQKFCLNDTNKLNDEQWINIKEYPNYLVSCYGRVLNKNTNRLLKIGVSNCGYPFVSLWKSNKGKTITVHTLVYSNFYNDFDLQGFVINHKDGNKLNNNINNLEKITYQENNYHAVYKIKTNKCNKPVLQYDLNHNFINEYASINEAFRKTGINNIGRAAKTGRTAGGFFWSFKK